MAARICTCIPLLTLPSLPPSLLPSLLLSLSLPPSLSHSFLLPLKHSTVVKSHHKLDSQFSDDMNSLEREVSIYVYNNFSHSKLMYMCAAGVLYGQFNVIHGPLYSLVN